MKRVNKSSGKNDSYTMTIKEQIVYINLVVACFDKTETTNISVKTLAERSGMAPKTVEKALSSLEANKFIKICVNDTIKVLKQPHFEFFSSSVLGLVDYTSTVVAFRLASCRAFQSTMIELNDTEILDRIGIGRTAFTQAKKDLIAAGIITKEPEGYWLNPEYFPSQAKTVSPEMKERAAALRNQAKNGIEAGIVFEYYAKREFKDLKMSPDKLVEWCEAGCPGLKKPKSFSEKPYIIPEDNNWAF